MVLEETKTFKVTLSAYPESAERLKARLKKFFRRRARSVAEHEPERLEIEMRNGSQIHCRLSDSRNRSRFGCEPIAEILLTTTSAYLDYSISAARRHAEKSDSYLRIDVEEQKPRK